MGKTGMQQIWRWVEQVGSLGMDTESLKDLSHKIITVLLYNNNYYAI